MTDDLESVLRDRLHTAVLPPAPESTREYVARLPRTVPRPASVTGTTRMALVAATVAAVVVAAGGLWFAAARPAVPEPSLASSPEPSLASSSPGPSVRVGFKSFAAPGITFAYPDEWTDQTKAIHYPNVPGTRFIALFGQGLSICPIAYDSPSSSPPPPSPAGCRTEASAPGTMIVSVLEMTAPYPGLLGGTTAKTAAGYPINVQGGSSTWSILAPDGGVYVISALGPAADQASRVAAIESLLATLRLSPWESPPPVVDGHVHLDVPQYGFAFDYPAGWIVYYPQDASMMDGAVVTVASRPVDPCLTDQCQRFTTPADTVVIEFRVGNGPQPPDWIEASATIGGQPAFRQDWGPQNATAATEGHSWSVRLTDPHVLGIYASLGGPGLPDLRASMDEVLGSIRITRTP